MIFGNHRIGNRIHHLRAGFDDAAPLRIAADHESVDVVEENKRNQVLIAVHDEASGLLRRLGIDHAAELNALVAFVIGLLRMQFLIGDDADGEAADSAVSADQCLAVLRLVLVKAAAIENARQHFLHVIRTSGDGS